METGLPMLNCLLQHTLRSLCSSSSDSSSSSSSKWVYAIFWRILPRNFPPPKWDYLAGSNALERSKGNKRNWILVWEDGFCDIFECEAAAAAAAAATVGNGSGFNIKGRFGADLFFKMSHEVYNFGEGLIGKVAADNSHKWVFSENSSNEKGEHAFIPYSWNASIDPQPRAWESHFRSGIQTIAIMSVREGIIQLASFNKIPEDLNLIVNVQQKFSYLYTIPGVFAIQRSYPPTDNYYNNNAAPTVISRTRHLTGMKRLFDEIQDDDYNGHLMIKHMNSGGPSLMWPIPPLMPCSQNGVVKAESECYSLHEEDGVAREGESQK